MHDRYRGSDGTHGKAGSRSVACKRRKNSRRRPRREKARALGTKGRGSFRRQRGRRRVHDESLRRRDGRLSRAARGHLAARICAPIRNVVSDSFAAAVANARVPYVVDLSSIGAQHAEKTGPIVGLHNLEQKLNRIRWPQRPPSARRLFHGKSSDEHSADALDGNSSRRFDKRSGDAVDCYEGYRQVRRYSACWRAIFPGRSTQELHGQRDISMKEAASDRRQVHRQTQARIHAGAIYDAGTCACSDGNAEEHGGAVD